VCRLGKERCPIAPAPNDEREKRQCAANSKSEVLYGRVQKSEDRGQRTEVAIERGNADCGTGNQSLLDASKKSAREIPDCEQMVRRVDALRVEWFGIVSGVRLPSGFCRTIEMCFRSRMISNLSVRSARRTFASAHRPGISSLAQRSLGNKGLHDVILIVESVFPETFNMKSGS
jgi:hypothetical protein